MHGSYEQVFQLLSRGTYTAAYIAKFTGFSATSVRRIAIDRAAEIELNHAEYLRCKAIYENALTRTRKPKHIDYESLRRLFE